jgi:hypothetical protein
MSSTIYLPLLDSSKKFLEFKKVYRFKLKKISDMSDEEIITACHHFVEDNNLKQEWYAFREQNESGINE